jgi:DNA-binding response OmpR family regulator
MRVLLIEDDPSLCTFYSRALGRAGYEVILEHRGDDGLRLALTLPFDIIVLDWYLPGMDGISVLKELREQGSDLPVLVLSGSGDLGREEAIASGADAFLGKPCGLQELSNCVSLLAASAEARKATFQVA